MSRSSGLVFVFALGGCVASGPSAAVDEALMVCAKGPVVQGVDVSHYDGAIDWGKVKAAGIDFTFMKATETTTFTDPEFAANWKFAGSNGIIRGAYHFLRPEVDPVAQADYFLSVMGPSLPGDLPPALDLEVTDNLTGAQVAASALMFLQRLQEKTGRVPIIYTSASFMSSIGSPAGFESYTLWVAHWTTMCPNLPPAWPSWTFWQNSATGTVDGIPSTKMVDLDQFNGTLSDLQNFVGSGAVTGDGGAATGDGGAATGDGGTSARDGGGGGGVDAGGNGGNARARSGCSYGGDGDAGRAQVLFLIVVAAAFVMRRRRARR